jgi:predicted MPP superfamily phosphohydrolase
LKAWPLIGISLMQAFLFLAHWFIFHTVVVFAGDLSPASTLALRCTLFSLAFSFIVAALLSYRFSNPLVIAIYRIAAIWLGFLNYFFWAACFCWLADLVLLLPSLAADRLHHRLIIAGVLFALAALASVYGLLNALWIRVRRISVSLPNLPASWRGRTALVISDLHLGNINSAGFSRRIMRKAAALNPDIVFIPGDFYDGTRVDAAARAAPFRELAPPLGAYFSTGNHDEYGDLPHFLEALKSNGVRILSNEKVDIDGLSVLGVPYGASTHLLQLRATLEGMQLDASRPSILLSHVPNRLPIAEQAGVSLQISGHTHGGQLIPFTWFTRRAFGKFTYGLQKFGAMQVYTSYGAGTWGPPMRVGTSPEIVLLEFK